MYFLIYEIPAFLSEVLGLLGWLSIILLPGTWIAFGLNLKGFSFSAKAAIAIALSPLVIFFEFYFLRAFLAVSFARTVSWLAVVNLPALFLIVRKSQRPKLPKRSTAAAVVVILAFTILLLSPQIFQQSERIFSGHSWMHSDIVYEIANGQLVPDEPEMAGMRLGYPSSGHVFQACLSFLLNSAPMSSYIWTNLIWIICLYAFSFLITKELGGNRFASVTSFVWLSLGLNFIGFLLQAILPESISHPLWIGGDYRYTPWLLKFFFFEQIMYGLALFAALLFLSIEKESTEDSGQRFTLLILILLGIGILYPILLPSAAVLVGAKAFAPFLDRTRSVSSSDISNFWKLALAGAFCTLIAFFYLKFLTQARVTGSVEPPSFSGGFLKELVLKLQSALTAISIYLVPILLASERVLKIKRASLIVIAAAAAGSLLLNIVLKLPFWGNEYKFVFPAAICLAPLAAIASEKFFKRLGARAIPVFICFSAVLSLPLVDKIYNEFPWIPVPHPAADVSSFNIKLADENEARMFEEIRRKTDRSAIVAAKRTSLHFPTLMQRRMYAPPRQKDPHPGINVDSVDMVGNVRGLGMVQIASRRKTVETLVDANNEASWLRARREVLQFGTQIVLIVPRAQTVPEWISRPKQNELLFQDDKFSVWILKGSDEILSDPSAEE